MAFRGKLKSMLNRLGDSRSFATATATASPPKSASNADYAPIYMVAGMIAMVATLGGFTVKQNLVHSPSVSVNKSRRECVAELDDPDAVVASADKYISKSFFRKVAHIQESKHPTSVSGRPDPFTSPRNAETLKSVGIQPPTLG